MKKILSAFTIFLLLISVSAFAADGDLIVNGNVGVGTTTPSSKLDVSGGVRIGNVSSPCSATIEGVIRYNSVTKVIEFCNGTDWTAPAQSIDTYTKLLIHADGNGNSFTDSSSSNKTITAYGNVTQSSNQYKFGGKSAYFDGSETYLSLADSDDWNFGTGDFTIDFWINLAHWNGSSYQMIAAKFGNSDNHWSLHTYLGVKRFRFATVTNGTAKVMYTDLHSLTDDTWHHIALVRSSGNFTWFIDGAIIGTASNNIGTADSIANPSAPLTIGYSQIQAGNYMTGYIDELRISKGIARWTSNFTPPTAPY